MESQVGYWQYGDCGETYVGIGDFAACCEAALAESAVSERDIDRFSFHPQSGRCFFKCPGSWIDNDHTSYLSSQEGALSGAADCSCLAADEDPVEDEDEDDTGISPEISKCLYQWFHLEHVASQCTLRCNVKRLKMLRFLQCEMLEMLTFLQRGMLENAEIFATFM